MREISTPDKVGANEITSVLTTLRIRNLALVTDLTHEQQRLVLVRPVHVDEPVADAGERAERGGGAVDELAVGARAGEGPLEQQLVIGARLEPERLEFAVELGRQAADVEGRLDGAALLAGADQTAIGTLAKDEVEGAEEDGFAGARFAGQRGHAALEFDIEAVDQDKVADGKLFEHGVSAVTKSG